MPRYKVTLTEEEVKNLEAIIQKGGKGYRIKRANILLKLNVCPENEGWTYDRIMDAYGVCRDTIARVAKRFVLDGMEAALERKPQKNHARKVTGEVEAQICMIACSAPPEGKDRWTMQMIADKLIELKVVDYITDSAISDTMKKTNLSPGWSKSGAFRKPMRSL